MNTASVEAEKIENDALRSLHGVADKTLTENLGLRMVSLGDTTISIASALPASAITINRTLGFGRSPEQAFRDTKTAVGLYRQAGVERFFVQPSPNLQANQTDSQFRQSGLKPARAWQKFSRSASEPVSEINTEFNILAVDQQHCESFAEIVCDAFDLGSQAVPWLAKLPEAKGWHAFMAFLGDAPAGCGALYVDGDAAYTDFGATSPKFRSRGVQSSLLSHRVSSAIEMGAKRLYTCTGVAVPGDPQHSYANILKNGFSETHARDNWQPA
ncbi:MAG: hypothetical protein GKR97_08400 [Rhizobiaceae bacterium]|nr:hypothetical protein [Rhizobiaceae bacterium]